MMRQDVSDVDDALGTSLAAQSTLDVGDATGIAGHHQRRAGYPDILQLAGQHGGGDLGVFNRENPAETAAISAIGQLDQFRFFDCPQQQARLTIYAQLAQQMAGRVVGKFARPAGSQVDHAQVIDQEFGELKSALGQSLARGSQSGSSENSSR